MFLKKHTPKPEFFLKIFILNNAVKILFLIYTANKEMKHLPMMWFCLLYTSDAADERSSVDLGGRRIIKKKNKDISHTGWHTAT